MLLSSDTVHVAQDPRVGPGTTHREDADLRHFCGMLNGLAFLPLAEVPAGMTHLRNVAPVELADLVDYFDATFVTSRYRVVQLPAVHAGASTAFEKPAACYPFAPLECPPSDHRWNGPD